MAFTHYYYTGQLKKYLLQFSNIFAGLQIRTGKGADGNHEMIPVPIVYGSVDRVAAAIKSRNTQNQPITIPMMSSYLKGLDIAPERRKGVNFVHNSTIIDPTSPEAYPNNLKVLSRVSPIPYNAELELSLYASNTLELQQMLEQILMVFDPSLQIQTTDKQFDWTKLTTVELVGINNEENYPIADEKRILQWSLDFIVPIWINPPAEMKSNIVKSITIQIGTGALVLDEFDENGNLVPFTEEQLVGTINIGANDV